MVQLLRHFPECRFVLGHLQFPLLPACAVPLIDDVLGKALDRTQILTTATVVSDLVDALSGRIFKGFDREGGEQFGV